MNIQQIQADVQNVLVAITALIGTVYVLVSAIGAATPNSKLGQFCRRFAADLHQIAPAATKDVPSLPAGTVTTPAAPASTEKPS